jgi:glycosyltransferase involved in cell wall biosynthesis
MRIGIEAQRIFRAKKHGMDIYALQLIRQLQIINDTNEYYIFVRPGEDVCLSETTNFRIIQIKGFNYMDWEQIQLPKAVLKYKVDILHCTSNTAPISFKIPTVVTLHDIIYLNKSFAGGSYYQRLGHYYRKWIVPLGVKKASKILTVSNFERQTILKFFGVGESKLKVIYNGLNQDFKNEPDPHIVNEVKKQFNLPNKFLLFLGNTAPKKNMRGTLLAYSKYAKGNKKSLPLVIVESDRSVVTKMLEDIHQSDMIDKIHLTGYIPNNQLLAVYHLAEIFLYPSLRESFGMPIIEAMACGTTVITSDTSSMPEIGGDAAIYVNPTNSQQLANTMQILLSDDNLISKMRALGLKRAQLFSWDKTARQTLDVYEQLNSVTTTYQHSGSNQQRLHHHLVQTR